MSGKIQKLEAAHKYAAHRRYYRKEMQALSERGDLFLKALQDLRFMELVRPEILPNPSIGYK